eukprot:gene4921-34691_t
MKRSRASGWKGVRAVPFSPVNVFEEPKAASRQIALASRQIASHGGEGVDAVQQFPAIGTSPQATRTGMNRMIQNYPQAKVTHQQVTNDYGLFKVTLHTLLTSTGIKLKICKVEGQDIDLHLLYKEVTTLGGQAIVTSEKKELHPAVQGGHGGDWLLAPGWGESRSLEDVAIRELFCHSQQQDMAATEGQVLKRMKTAHVADVPFKPRPALFYFAKTINPHLAAAVYPGMDVLKATVEVAGTLWKRMSPEQRQPFVDTANLDLLFLGPKAARLFRTAPPPAAPKDKAPTAAAVSEGGQPQCPQSQATNSQAQQGFTLSPLTHYKYTTQSNVPMLPSSHPPAMAMIDVHAKAVAAARAAEAMPPPPPRMLGILQVPHPQSHKAHEEEDWFTQKTPYQSESNMFKQPFPYHAKGSCEPSNVDQSGQQKAYSHSNVDHVDQPGQQTAYSHSNVDHVDQSGQQKAYSHSNVDHVDQPEQKPSSYPPILCDAETLAKNYASEFAQINASDPVECGGQHGGHKEPLKGDFPSLGNEHDATFTSLGNEHDATLASLGNEHDATLASLGNEHDATFASLLENGNFFSEDNNRKTMPSLLDQDAINFADNIMVCDKDMEEDACGLLSNSQETNRQTTPSVLDQDAINFADHVMACYMEMEKEEDVCGLLFNSQDTSPSTQGATAYADSLFSEPDHQPQHAGRYSICRQPVL